MHNNLSKGEPISDKRFACLMDKLQPFEQAPHVAVAVSGGADSLALTILLANWVRHINGTLTALTVDHGLRNSSEEESKAVAVFLESLGIRHHILKWRAPIPRGGIQSVARKMRFKLLERWCRDNSVLHLLFGHHIGDQAETILMRIARGNHYLSLSAMNPIRETTFIRILRPLLDVEKNDLVATLHLRGVQWVQDPFNVDRRFSRVRARAILSFSQNANYKIAQSSKRFGKLNCRLNSEVTEIIARAVTLFSEGFIIVKKSEIESLSTTLIIHIFARIIATIGNSGLRPRLASLERLAHSIFDASFKSRTLGRCLFMPSASEILVCREVRNLPMSLRLEEKSILKWDDRFLIEINKKIANDSYLAPLSQSGWTQIMNNAAAKPSYLPFPVRFTLPAIFDERGVKEVPHLNFQRDLDKSSAHSCTCGVKDIKFIPNTTLSGISLGVV